MVQNIFVKCTECDKIFRLRWQVGYQQVILKTYCPNCKNMFEVVLKIDDSSDFYNVNQVNYDKRVADYLIELSTEFFTKKIQKDYDQLENQDFLTPFMRNMDIDRNKISDILSFAHDIDKVRTKIETIFSMQDNESVYLKQNLQKSNFFKNMFSETKINYSFDTNLDILICVHQYINNMLFRTYPPKTIKNMTEEINRQIINLARCQPYSINKFLNILCDNDIFKQVNKKFSGIVIDILNNYLNLVPMYIRDDLSTVDLQKFGINTIRIDEVLNIYKKCYEFIGEYCLLPIGLNNIKERNDCDSFKNNTNNIYTFLNSITSKYNRLNNYLITGEQFSSLFDSSLNNIIRNSEAHFDYSFDIISQIVSFRDKNKKKDLYLIEVARELLNIYQKTVYLWEINYCLHKLYLINIKKETLSITVEQS